MDYHDVDIIEIEPDPEVETYHLVQDDDGHWYVIPDDADDDFRQWVEDTQNDDDGDFDFSENRINGHPSLLHFKNYWVE